MTNKKVFECSRNCKNCTYENKQCGGYDEFSECISDKCPSGNYAIGNIDNVGGKHTNEGNWNPIGERCSLCAPKDCTNCDKWKRRQAENKTPLELFAEFFYKQNNKEMDEEQTKIIEILVEKIWEQTS